MELYRPASMFRSTPWLSALLDMASTYRAQLQPFSHLRHPKQLLLLASLASTSGP